MNKPTDSESMLLDSLNLQQREAVLCKDKQILCIAGAGTGKTTTLISRISYETQVLNHDPLSILCLTFTNAAANEFLARYRLQANSTFTPNFSTFHAFCYSVLCQENIYKLLHYKSIPSIIDENQEKLYIDRALLLSSVKLPKHKLKVTYRPNPIENFQYIVYMKTLYKLLREDNVITFDILCYEVCKLFINDDPSIMAYKQQYKSIYVDEFQDTDTLQWQFVQSFQNSTKFLVGDENQAIYAFRGATSEFIEEIQKDPTWHAIKLEWNYRSTPSICEFANTIISSPAFELKSCRKDAENHPVSIIQLNADYMANIEPILTDTDDLAVICRTNAEIAHVCQVLDSQNIRYNSKASTKELVLCALNDEYYDNYLLSMLNEPERLRLVRGRMLNKIPATYILELKATTFKYFDNQVKCVQALPAFTRLQQEINSATSFNETQASVDAFYRTYIEKSAENVYVGTIHSVKGKEFDSVIVYDVESSYFKLNSKENLNLFYVACTRAKNNLIILTPDKSLLEKQLVSVSN